MIVPRPEAPRSHAKTCHRITPGNRTKRGLFDFPTAIRPQDHILGEQAHQGLHLIVCSLLSRELQRAANTHGNESSVVNRAAQAALLCHLFIAQAALEVGETATPAAFRRVKRSPMAPMSTRAPNPTTRWAVSTSQCRSPARIICCVTPKIGTMNA